MSELVRIVADVENFFGVHSYPALVGVLVGILGGGLALLLAARHLRDRHDLHLVQAGTFHGDDPFAGGGLGRRRRHRAAVASALREERQRGLRSGWNVFNPASSPPVFSRNQVVVTPVPTPPGIGAPTSRTGAPSGSEIGAPARLAAGTPAGAGLGGPPSRGTDAPFRAARADPLRRVGPGTGLPAGASAGHRLVEPPAMNQPIAVPRPTAEAVEATRAGHARPAGERRARRSLRARRARRALRLSRSVPTGLTPRRRRGGGRPG